jgi:hypothetical protein
MGDMSSYSDDLGRMLAMATRDESMRRTLMANADRFGAFDGADHVWPALFWRVLRSWASNYSGGVPCQHFEDMCAAQAEKEFGDSSGVREYARWLCSVDLACLSRPFLVDRLRSLCSANADSAMRETALTGSVADVETAMSELKAAMSIGEIPAETKPFADGMAGVNRMIGEQKRRPLGVPFIDVSAGGGMVGGEMLLAMMPSGAGKTTLSFQLCDACVRRERHVLYLQFEQPLKGDLMRRALVLASGTTRDDWAVGSVEEVSPAVLESLKANMARWDKYFHFIDHWQKPGAKFPSVSVIGDLIEQYKQAGQAPYLVVIDWWGIVRSMILACSRLRSDSERRDYINVELKLLASLADHHDVRFVVFQQMSGASAAKGKPGSMFEGMEDKTIGLFFDLVMTSDRPDKSDGTISLLFDKARMGAGGTIRQRLDGQRCKFVDPPEESYRMGAPARDGGAQEKEAEDEGSGKVQWA